MVLIFAESGDGKIRKAGQEAITYGKRLAEKAGVSCTAVILGPLDHPEDAGKYGADQVVHVTGPAFDHFDAQVWARAISDVALEKQAGYVILSHSSRGKALTGRLAIRLNAACVSGANDIPDLGNGCLVSKGVYSGKAFATIRLETDVKVISVMCPASFVLGPRRGGGLRGDGRVCGSDSQKKRKKLPATSKVMKSQDILGCVQGRGPSATFYRYCVSTPVEPCRLCTDRRRDRPRLCGNGRRQRVIGGTAGRPTELFVLIGSEGAFRRP